MMMFLTMLVPTTRAALTAVPTVAKGWSIVPRFESFPLVATKKSAAPHTTSDTPRTIAELKANAPAPDQRPFMGHWGACLMPGGHWEKQKGESDQGPRARTDRLSAPLGAAVIAAVAAIVIRGRGGAVIDDPDYLHFALVHPVQ